MNESVQCGGTLKVRKEHVQHFSLENEKICKRNVVLYHWFGTKFLWTFGEDYLRERLYVHTCT